MKKTTVVDELARYLQDFVCDIELKFFRASKGTHFSLSDPNFMFTWLMVHECDVFTDVYNGLASVDATKRSLRATILIKEFEVWFVKLKPHSSMCILFFMFAVCMSYHRYLRRDKLLSEKEYVESISKQLREFTLEAQRDYCLKPCKNIFCKNYVPFITGKSFFNMQTVVKMQPKKQNN